MLQIKKAFHERLLPCSIVYSREIISHIKIHIKHYYLTLRFIKCVKTDWIFFDINVMKEKKYRTQQ